MNTGDIKVYCNIGSDSTKDELIVALPITDIILLVYLLILIIQFKAFYYLLISMRVHFTLGGFHHFRYRYILIPGGIKAGRGANGGTKMRY